MAGCFQQFFESINPRSDFDNDNDKLETYLYDKSLKLQPRECEKPPAHDVVRMQECTEGMLQKPKHPLSVLKSPGVKVRGNHYTSEQYQQQAGTSDENNEKWVCIHFRWTHHTFTLITHLYCTCRKSMTIGEKQRSFTETRLEQRRNRAGGEWMHNMYVQL